MPSSIFIHKKRVIFTSPEVSFNIRITKRTKQVWYGEENGVKYMVRYLIKDSQPALIFLPEVGSQKLGVMISRTNLCE